MPKGSRPGRGRSPRGNAADDVEDDIDAAIEPVLAAVPAAGGYKKRRTRIEDGTLFDETDADNLAALLARVKSSAEASGEG